MAACVLDADDIAVATWAFQHGTIAGYDTDTLHGSRLRYIPLQSSQGVLGIMGVKPAEPDGVITHEQDRILMAFANQTALALERVNLVRPPGIRERRSPRREYPLQMIPLVRGIHDAARHSTELKLDRRCPRTTDFHGNFPCGAIPSLG